jgi:plastocyanin
MPGVLAWRAGRDLLRPLAALAVAAALGACAGATRIGPSRSVTVSLSEYRLRPNALQVSPGRLQIVVRNLGSVTHDLVVARGNIWMAVTRPLFPGQSQTLTLTLARGRYTMFSSLLSDQALGVYGTVQVGR